MKITSLTSNYVFVTVFLRVRMHSAYVLLENDDETKLGVPALTSE